jgi:hypothetical protein
MADLALNDHLEHSKLGSVGGGLDSLELEE